MATMLVRAWHIDIELDGERWRHVGSGRTPDVQRLPELNRATIHGRRKHNYFKRQHLIELGPRPTTSSSSLVHRHVGGTWSPVVNTRVQEAVRSAQFPFAKTIEELRFVFQASINREALGPWLGPSSSARVGT